MAYPQFFVRLQGRYIRLVDEVLFRRPLKMNNTVPFISFTFDDFPRSALHTGGNILNHYGFRATYYASLGLMGKEAPTGKIFTSDDLKILFAQGHELGCHTFAHSHSWETSPIIFEDSIIKNKRALDGLVPGAVFRSFSYPVIGPRPGSKRRAGKYFRCCRGGGQTFNVGIIDLNYLKAYFLEKSRDNLASVKEVINRNCHVKGWLIFATHDISKAPTQYGCTPSFLEEVVQYAQASGTTILPVAEALDAIALNSASEASSDKIVLGRGYQRRGL